MHQIVKVYDIMEHEGNKTHGPLEGCGPTIGKAGLGNGEMTNKGTFTR